MLRNRLDRRRSAARPCLTGRWAWTAMGVRSHSSVRAPRSGYGRAVASGRLALSKAARAFAAVALQAALGHADTPGLELRWSAPAECPTQREVLRSVEQLLAGTSAVPLRAEARVDKRTDG